MIMYIRIMYIRIILTPVPKQTHGCESIVTSVSVATTGFCEIFRICLINSSGCRMWTDPEEIEADWLMVAMDIS